MSQSAKGTSPLAARLEAALKLAAQGFLIAKIYGIKADGGCACGNPDCKKRGKHGGVGWKDYATREVERITTWLSAGDPNYMAVPAEGSSLLVVDEDEPGTLELLGPLPATFTVQTGVTVAGTRGRHVYGRLPEGIDEGLLPYRWVGGEVRFGGNGGVVGPGSAHASGVSYDPLNDLPVSELPEPWVRALINSGSAQKALHDTASGPEDDGWVILPGERHEWLKGRAGALRGAGLPGDALRDGMLALNKLRCQPPLPDEEVAGLALWAASKEGDPGPDVYAAARPRPRNVGASMPPPDLHDWVIEGVLRPKSILVVASPEGLGKSFIRKEMATRLTTGTGMLFGHYPIPRRCSVLEIDEENGEAEEFRREQEVLRALGVERTAAASYWSLSFPALDLADERSRSYLREHVTDIQPKVLMLDTGTSMVSEEWGADFKHAMRFVRSLAVQFGCAVVIFVHLVKPPRGRDRSNRIHGTAMADVMGQWPRLADAVALLADLGDGRANWSMFKKVPKSDLVIKQAGGLWEVVHVGAERRLSSEDRVLRAISSGGENPPSIATSLDMSSRAVSNAIGRLRKAGLLEARHPYRLTDAGREAVG